MDIKENNKETTEATTTHTLSTEQKVRDNMLKKKKRKTIRRLIRLGIAIVVIGGGLYVYQSYKTTGVFPWQDAEAIKLASLPAPEELTVQKLKYSTTVDLSGELLPLQEDYVYSKTEATVTAVYVEKGDTVQKGDLLVAMDDTDIQYNIADIEQQIKESEIKGTSSNLALLKMQLKSYEADLDDTKLYAPYDGIITEVAVSVGDYADYQDECIEIIDATKLIADVYIDEIDLRYITEDSTATFTFDAVPGETAEAKISYMPYDGYYSDEGIGEKLVEFTIDDVPEGVYPGFSFEGTIEGSSQEEMLIINEDAITTTDGVSTVNKQTDDGIEKVVVTTQYLSEGYVQILTGDVSEGDTLLIMKNSTASSDDDDSSSLLSGSILGGGGPGQGPGQGPNSGTPRKN